MKRVAIIVDDLFEDSELGEPLRCLREAGHRPVVVGRVAGKQLRGKHGREVVPADTAVDDVSASDFDALVIPGGYSPDRLRTIPGMVRFTQDFFEADAPVAAICHGPSMLVEADVVRGRTLTSWPSIKTDLVNAGAIWVDREVVVDGNLITSRKPADLPAFCSALLQALSGPTTQPSPERLPESAAGLPEAMRLAAQRP
jgi:protease I